MTDDRAFEELTRDECIELLGTQTVGRVAVVVDDGSPLVVPGNYAVDGDVAVFRTGPGSKLAGLRTQPVSFEVDDFDGYRRTGWSVLVRGVCYEVNERDAGTSPDSWAPGEKSHWVRVAPMEITGRRITWSGPSIDARGYL